MQLIAVSIPATLLALICTSLFYLFWDKLRQNDQLPVHMAVTKKSLSAPVVQGARRSVLIFIFGLVVVLFYAIIASPKTGVIIHPVLNSGQVRISVMMAVALAIVMFCRVNVNNIPATSVFKTGMTSCICILGVAWLGSTFMDSNQVWFQSMISGYLLDSPLLLAIIIMLASCFLYSQAASTKILFPIALSMGIAPATLVACFPATASLFILPNYPTLLAAVTLDDTGSTKLGNRIIDHPFIVPGLMATVLSILFAAGFALFI